MAEVASKVNFKDFPKKDTNIASLTSPYVVGFCDNLDPKGRFYERSFPISAFVLSGDLDNYVTQDELDNYVTTTSLNTKLSNYATKEYVDEEISKITISTDTVVISSTGLFLKGEESGLWYRIKIKGAKNEEYLGFDEGISSIG